MAVYFLKYLVVFGGFFLFDVWVLSNYSKLSKLETKIYLKSVLFDRLKKKSY